MGQGASSQQQQQQGQDGQYTDAAQSSSAFRNNPLRSPLAHSRSLRNPSGSREGAGGGSSSSSNGGGSRKASSNLSSPSQAGRHTSPTKPSSSSSARQISPSRSKAPIFTARLGSSSNSNNGSNINNHNNDVGADGLRPPRRKSLDMPDLSLSMTTSGSVTATPSALPTPSIPLSPGLATGSSHSNSNNNNNNTAARQHQTGLLQPTHPNAATSGPSTAGNFPYPFPGQVVSSSSNSSSFSTYYSDNGHANAAHNGEGGLQQSLMEGTGVPMAPSPLASGPPSSSSPAAQALAATARLTKGRPGMTSPTAQVSKDGLLFKKGQPVTGSAAALHAVAFGTGGAAPSISAPATSLNSPSGTQVALSSIEGSSSSAKSRLPPVLTGASASHTVTPGEEAACAKEQLDSRANQPSNAVPPASRQANLANQSLFESITSPISPASSAPTTVHGGSLPFASLGPLAPPPMPTPLKQPTETILAPELPPDVSLTAPPLLSSAAAAQEFFGNAANPPIGAGVPIPIDELADLAAAGVVVGGTIAVTAPIGLGTVPSSSSNSVSNLLPSGSAAGTTAAIVAAMGGSAVASAAGVNIAGATEGSVPLGGGYGGSGSGANTPTGSLPTPLIPGSTPPLGNPPNTLPAAAPIAILNPTLAQDPVAQEQIKAATVDLGGPDGVPTLLTWKANEEDAAEQDTRSFVSPESRGILGNADVAEAGTPSEGDLPKPDKLMTGPQQVFVTGTFANWNTKIELRRKEGEDHKQTNDFTALVKLPPGPHSLKFIVDKQWKTSKYLPSATDADGNLINYLQVHKVDAQAPQTRAAQEQALTNPLYYHVGLGASDRPRTRTRRAEDEVDPDAGAEWTSDIPAVLLAYGDATEAALDAQEAQERYMAERQGSIHSHNGGSSSLPTQGLPAFIESSSGSGGAGGAGGSGVPGSFTTGGSEPPTAAGPSSIPSSVLEAQFPAMMALNRKPLSQLQTIQPPILPAQLEKGVLNSTVLVAKGSGDDNSILPKPDHSVLNHLAASPIKGGLLSVGVTTRYRQKYVTTVYYKKPVV